MNRTSSWVAGIAVVCLSVAPAACARPPERATVPASSSSTATDPSAARSWLAGLRVERDPDALDDDTQALTDVLGSSLVVSPASCLRGLPDGVGSSTYVLGAVASTPEELDGLIARTGREPLFEVEVEVLCTD